MFIDNLRELLVLRLRQRRCDGCTARHSAKYTQPLKIYTYAIYDEQTKNWYKLVFL